MGVIVKYYFIVDKSVVYWYNWSIMEINDLIGKKYPVKDLNNQIAGAKYICDAFDLSNQAGYAIQLTKEKSPLVLISYELASRIVNHNEFQDLST